MGSYFGILNHESSLMYLLHVNICLLAFFLNSWENITFNITKNDIEPLQRKEKLEVEVIQYQNCKIIKYQNKYKMKI